AGYMQYIEIQNLKVALSGTGADYAAIEFGNGNPGFGHITFSGNTSIEMEHDGAGSPVAIKVSTGAQTGTPIRFENLSVVDQSARTSGDGIRPILMQTQSEISKGLRQMNIDRFFFEQHYAPAHTIMTIEPPFGKLATPFFESTPMSFVGAGGTGASPTTGEYVVVTTPVVVTSTAPWSLKDSAGNLIETVPATEARTVPLGYRVQFPTGIPSIFA